MSLSAEALAQLKGLDLQEAREGLNFVPAAGAGEFLGADLSAEEMSGLRGWDLNGVLAKLNGLTFESVHPDLVSVSVLPIEPLPVPMPMPEPEAAPTGAAAPIPDAEEELPDWLKPAEPESEEPAPGGPMAEEAAAEVAMAASVAGSGGRIREFLASKRGQGILTGVEFVGSTAIGFIIADILRLGPGQEAAIAFTAQSALGLTRLGTELGARTVEGAEARFPKFARLSQQVAGEKGLAGVLRNIRDAATRLQYDPIVSGLTIGIIGHSFYEALSGRPSIIPDTHAAEPTPGPAAADTGTPTATATETPTGTPTPEATPISGGATGGLPPDMRGSEALQPPAETVVPHLPQVPVDSDEAQLQAAEMAQQAAAQAAEAARIAALQQGPTVAELAANMPKQTVSEAIYQMIGDVPHRGEVTNVLFRAIGDKVNSLNEGAIKAAAEALRPVFDNIDQVVTNSGVPYIEGGRAVVEIAKGFNSPEAQAIRAANMADLEAAGNLFNNVIGPVIK